MKLVILETILSSTNAQICLEKKNRSKQNYAEGCRLCGEITLNLRVGSVKFCFLLVFKRTSYEF